MTRRPTARALWDSIAATFRTTKPDLSDEALAGRVEEILADNGGIRCARGWASATTPSRVRPPRRASPAPDEPGDSPASGSSPDDVA